MADDIDQEALAAQWAEQLAEESGGGQADADALFEAAQQAPAAPAGGAAPAAAAQPAAAEEEQLADRWAEALAAEEEPQARKQWQSPPRQGREAQFKNMTEIARQPRDETRRELDFILDIPLDVSAELGRTRLLINELLQLGQGSVVELNKLAGEPLEVFVNGKLVARGEAVVINEKFGVRLTDIISPIERVKQLG